MVTAKKPLVTIAILNWNGLANTQQCLKSVRKLNYPNTEIIVVDNGSTDGSKDFLRKQTDIILIDLPSNTGFTGGHLAAYKKARGNFILLLNNDLVVEPNWINAALSTFQKYPKAAAVGGKLYRWDNDNPVFSRNNKYETFKEVDSSTGYTPTFLVGDREVKAASVSGAALMLKCSSLKKVGYLDNDFFAYYEEADLIARLWRAGFETYYNPLALAWHKVAQTSGGEGNAFYFYMMHRNRFIFAVKNFDDEYLKTFLANYRKQTLRAILRFLLHQDKDSWARIKAYAWNQVHRPQTFAKRRKVMQLGKSYFDPLMKIQHDDVTVIIPCHNYGSYIRSAIESVLSQSHLPRKIIIIDDGSTDDSHQVIKKYQTNPLIEIITQPNRGVIATKNLGLSKSETYWTIFLDADDELRPTYIEQTIKFSEANRVDVVYTDMEIFGAVKDIVRSRLFELKSMLQNSYIHNSALIKTSFLKQVGGYKPEMRDGLEDWELYLSLYEVGARFGYLNQPIFKYRYHDSSLSRNSLVATREMEFYTRLIKLHPSLFSQNDILRKKTTRWGRLIKKLVKHPGIFLVIIKNSHQIFSHPNLLIDKVRSYLKDREGS